MHTIFFILAKSNLYLFIPFVFIMVSILYSLTAFSFALVLIIILLHDKRRATEMKREERAYWLLIKWVIFFCLQDVVWGICASDLVTSDLALFVSSTVFHLSTVGTTFFWLYFILTYLGNRVRHPKTLLALDGVVVLVQVFMVIVNMFHPIIFHIEGGRYVTEPYRVVAFFNQYVVYLAISVIAAIVALSKMGSRRNRYAAVFFYSIAPVLTGLAQFLYPDGPFYSMGYFFGCFIIHIFVVVKERDLLLQLQSHRRLSAQTKLANNDELTSLLNRHAYEVAMTQHQIAPSDSNFAYIAMDINGLKVVNDTLGHKAGDELIKGATDCMRICLGSYGKIYRTGGDEFVAIIHASERELEFILNDLDEKTLNWHGELVSNLSISVGAATKREFPNYPIAELAVVADERMYAAKNEYYAKKGIDRRGQHSAYTALCASYTKILKINVTKDTHSIIRMDVNEQTSQKGFASEISKWLHDFGISGQVHPDDLQEYLSATNIDSIRKFFRNGSRSLNIFYRRKSDNGFRNTKMEMIPAEDYSIENMNLYLYVKDIDR